MLYSFILLVMRLMDEALDAGLFVAVCSTSNEKAVTTIVRTLLGDRLGKIKVFLWSLAQ